MSDQIPTLLFDGACPLCRREIALVRRLTRKVQFQDVHQLSTADFPAGATRESLLRDLHLVWPNGQVDKGLAANVELWRQTPLGWIWQVFRWPIVAPLAQAVYRRWADRRFDKMGYCTTLEGQSVCEVQPSNKRTDHGA